MFMDTSSVCGVAGRLARGSISATPQVILPNTALKVCGTSVRGPTMPVGRKQALSEAALANPRMAQQEIWRKRLVEAETRYEDAALGLQSALAEDNGVAEARQRKMAARAEYLRLLRIFSDLVLRGKAPTDGDQISTRT